MNRKRHKIKQYTNTFIRSSLLLSIFLTCSAARHADNSLYEPERISLVNISGSSDIAKIKLADTSAVLVQDGQTKALEVTFKTKNEWSNIRFESGSTLIKNDWSDANMLAITVSNPEPKTIGLGLRIDPETPDGTKGKPWQCWAELDPGTKVTLIINIGEKLFSNLRKFSYGFL